ncbi:zinc finger MYM-type protein 1 [Trichonephila clavipes]|nr:zinc finger MYM-type protein 1 [Trichonephila clavipes]
MQNFDYQQPSEKDIVQPEDISNVPAEKCFENVGFDFEKYVDVAFRGTEEVFGSPHNGYFMGAPELLAEFNPFIQVLETNGLLLDNCTGQSFDNDANMFGRCNNVQAVIKEKNKFANYVPCVAHSPNLVDAE